MKRCSIIAFLFFFLITTALPFFANAAESSLQITGQPVSSYADEGQSICAEVIAIGEALQYQWYQKDPGQTYFSKSTVTESVYSFPISKATSGRQVYCVITDCHGNSVTSQTATLKIRTPLSIEKQPIHAYALDGQKAYVTVGARGDGLTYQWFRKSPVETKFSPVSQISNRYSMIMRSYLSGSEVYCVVSDCHGNSVTTSTVSMKMPTDLAIVEQPKSAQASTGQTVSASVIAAGDELQYQWYCKNYWQDQFYPTSIRSHSYSTTASGSTANCQVYCVITDRLGKKMQTETITLNTLGSFKQGIYRLKPQADMDLSAELDFSTDDELVWHSSDPSVATINDAGLLTCQQNGTTTITVTGKQSGIQAECTIVVTEVIQIALTFDDGPSSYTPQLLDFLKEKNIPATFFLVGNRMNYFSSTVQRIVEEGHEIAYHSYRHKNQIGLSSEQILSDYEYSNEILQSIAGVDFTLWRTPGGNYNTRVLDSIPLPHIMWSVDTLDWKYLSSYRVCNTIVNYADDGDIILMHDLYKPTVNGAIKAIEIMLEEGGYEFVTVSEILGRTGTAPEAHVSYSSAP